VIFTRKNGQQKKNKTPSKQMLSISFLSVPISAFPHVTTASPRVLWNVRAKQTTPATSRRSKTKFPEATVSTSAAPITYFPKKTVQKGGRVLVLVS